MPATYREVVLLIRAQNTATPAFRSMIADFGALNKAQLETLDAALMRGRNLINIGAIIGAVGVAGLAFYAEAAKQAVDYNKQVALTKTQMYGVKASFDQVAQAGLDVATKVAVPLNQIQGGLYDIFSSMDVNLSQAQFLLMNFSKEAVAGQVDLSTAERATIGIMNAYGLKVQDVTKVQDIMFNLVKYGVGTYEDFANSIGRVTGPAVRANQNFEQTAALMAFVTRNGLSASNAASSVGRALDAIGKSRDKIAHFGEIVVEALGPKVAEKLGITAKSMIKMTDASGKLLPINVIMTELGKALGGLNPTQLNDVLTTMFKGTGGTIQAMRFLDIAVHNYRQLNTIVNEMGHSKGALQAAYKIMANTPAMQIQLLKNNFQALMIKIGDIVLPGLLKLIHWIAILFTWIDKIPHRFLMIAVVVGLVGSALAVLIGVVLIMAGAFVIASAAMDALDIALLPLIGIVALILVGVAALAIGAYLIYKHWGPISKWFHQMWFDMWHWIDHIWGLVYKSIKDYWAKTVNVFLGIVHFFSSNFDKWWKTHGDSVKLIWKLVWDYVGRYIKLNLSIIVNTMKIFFSVAETVFKIGLSVWEAAAKAAWDIIVAIFRIAMATLTLAWRVFLTILLAVAKIGWAIIKAFFKTIWDVIVGLFSIFLDLVTGHWHTAWMDVLALGHQIWNNIKGVLTTIWHVMASVFKQIFGDIRDFGTSIWHTMDTVVHQVWNSIMSFFKGVWSDLRSGFKGVVHDLSSIWGTIENVFKTPVNFVIRYVYDDGIAKVWNTVVNAIGLKSIDFPTIATLSAGGRLAGFGGGDILPALLEPGETVIDKNMSRQYAWLFSLMGVKGYAGGGIIGQGLDWAKMALAILTGNPVAFANAMAGSFLGKSGGASGSYGSMLATLPGALLDTAIKGVWHKIVSAWNQPTNIGVGAGPGGGTAAQNQALARQLMPSWGFGPFWTDWLMLWNRESGWNQYAYNASSGATGIPQSLPYTKMPRAAWLPSQGGQANVRAQETWGIQYIESTYGNPANAWAHEVAVGWYGDGTDQVFTKPTLIGVGDGGAERVKITPLNKAHSGPVQNFYITTQEIDPRRHAAELGWELARRSSSLCLRR